VQAVVEHDYLVRWASFLVQVFHQKELYHEEDKGVSAVDDRSFERDVVGADPDKDSD
jgi:hypothetical protein